jgi:hypothetical protein
VTLPARQRHAVDCLCDDCHDDPDAMLARADAAAAARLRAAEREHDRQEREAKQRADRDAAMRRAAAVWRGLARRHATGETYLREQRGLDVELLVDLRVVRFDQAGDPHVALHSSAGDVVNVVPRRIDVGWICAVDGCATLTRGRRRCWKCNADLGGCKPGPKTPGLKDAPTAGTLVGHLQQLKARTTVIVTEGVVDTLTARCAWPGPSFVVLGAHGVGNFALVARYAARFVAQREGKLLLVGHNDVARPNPQTGVLEPGAGVVALDQAMHAALEEGLVGSTAAGKPKCRVAALAYGPHKDLNDAYRAGWRP